MAQEKKDPDFGDPGETDEVEILEVVGVDDEAPRPAPTRPADDDEEEYVLAMDEFDDTDAAALSIGERQREADAEGRETLLRLQADYDNLRRRVDRERRDFELFANSNLVSRLLPVLDNFERAMAMAAPDEGRHAFHEGMLLIYRQLTEALRFEGLRPIDAVGHAFDPTLHDAVETDATAEVPANTVVDELQRGYLFQERLLRPALVRVRTADGPERSDRQSGEGA